MVLLSLSFSLLIAALSPAAVNACGGHDHALEKRLAPPVPLAKPTRPLEWGDINFIHTTDSHGWLLGHQKTTFPEPNYSGDLGDFASFVKHMKDIAEKKDVDLLIVDSGDLHDGTGITDGFPVGGVDAHDANQFLKKIPYDIMAIGNHELYIYNNTLDMHTNFAPALNGKYLSSNVNITVTDKHNNSVSVPVGERFRKFTTRKGKKVTALGVLFDFTDNDVGTTVQKVEDMVKEEWFAEAIKEEPTFFLLVGHMPVAKDNWPTVFNAVRAVHPTTPILIFGGHTHIRDCNQPDGRSMALESGRYMETVGWMSVKLDEPTHGHSSSSAKNLTFTRRYLDPNRVTYEYHAGISNKTFTTSTGASITKGLLALAQKFNLDMIFGTAPIDYTVNGVAYPANNSLLTLFAAEAAPYALAQNNSRAGTPNIIIINSGSQRFDLYKGPFSRNDQFEVSPFDDQFLFVPDVPFQVANEVLPALNGAGADNRRRELLPGREVYEARYREWLSDMNRRSGFTTDLIARSASANLTLGYVTKDSCPGVGDDVPHTPLPFFSVPDFVASDPPTVDASGAPITNSSTIDLVFVDFIEDQLLGILNDLSSEAGTGKNYTAADVQKYGNFAANEILGVYAQGNWN